MPSINMLWQIFISFFKIDLMAFGGAYAAIPVIQKQIVDINGWLSYQEFADILAIDELTPGPIIINCATFIGTKMGGPLGALAATLGCIIPTALIASILLYIYLRYKGLNVISGALNGIKCLVCALLISSCLSIVSNTLWINGNMDIVAIILFVISFILMRKTKLDPIVIIGGCGLLGYILYLFI